MPNQSHKRIMVPRLPGSLIASKAMVKPEFCSAFSLGILKIPKALLGDLSVLTFFNSVSEILTTFFSEIVVSKSSVQNNVSISKGEFNNSFNTFTPSAINKLCFCLYFFCDKLVINFS